MFCRSLYTRLFFTPGNFYIRRRLHKKPFTQLTFTPEAFYIGSNSNQRTFTPQISYIKWLLPQNVSTPGTRTFYTKELLRQTASTHRRPFTLKKFTAESSRTKNFYTKQRFHQWALHQKPFILETSCTGSFYSKKLFLKELHARHRFHQKPTKSFYTRQLLHQKAFTPKIFFTPTTFYAKAL